MHEQILIRIQDSIHLQKYIVWFSNWLIHIDSILWSQRETCTAEVQTEEENTTSESQILLYMKKEP